LLLQKKQERQHVAVGLGNAQFVFSRQVASDVASRTADAAAAAAAATIRQFTD